MKKTKQIINRFLVPAIVTELILLVFLCSFLFYYHNFKLERLLPELNPEKDAFQIEYVGIYNDYLEICGWCLDVYRNMDASDEETDLKLVLVDADTYDRYYYYSIDIRTERPDVSDYYYGDYRNMKCGFSGNIDISSLDPVHNNYEVLMQENMISIRPGIFIRHGEIVFSNLDYSPLDVAGTDLESIINNGILRLYDVELGIFIYQYEWRLYYIADQNYPLDEGWAHIGFNVLTNNNDLLPDSRKEYGFDSLDFNFNSNEITGIYNTGKYRVAVINIPEKYPVVNIVSGCWISGEGWKWECIICPGLRK